MVVPAPSEWRLLSITTARFDGMSLRRTSRPFILGIFDIKSHDVRPEFLYLLQRVLPVSGHADQIRVRSASTIRK